MKTLQLVAENTTTKEPKSISVFNEKEQFIAKVFISGETEFSKVQVYTQELKQILTIAEIFNLFFNNLLK